MLYLQIGSLLGTVIGAVAALSYALDYTSCQQKMNQAKQSSGPTTVKLYEKQCRRAFRNAVFATTFFLSCGGFFIGTLGVMAHAEGLPMKVRVTAYCPDGRHHPCLKGCSGCYTSGVTRSGTKAREGVVAMTSRHLGGHVVLHSLSAPATRFNGRTMKVEDTGVGNRAVDLCVASCRTCCRIGVQRAVRATYYPKARRK